MSPWPPRSPNPASYVNMFGAVVDIADDLVRNDPRAKPRDRMILGIMRDTKKASMTIGLEEQGREHRLAVLLEITMHRCFEARRRVHKLLVPQTMLHPYATESYAFLTEITHKAVNALRPRKAVSLANFLVAERRFLLREQFGFMRGIGVSGENLEEYRPANFDEELHSFHQKIRDQVLPLS